MYSSDEEKAREVFRSRAPLVDLDELTETVHSFITDELREHVESIWVFGSFTIAGKELDEDHWSDLDIFIVHSDWELPQASTGMLLHEPSESVPHGDPDARESDWEDKLAGPKQWECDVSTAWEAIPSYVRETIRNSTTQGFFRNQTEYEAREVRYYDIFVGSEAQIAAQRERGRVAKDGMVSGFCLWERDD